MTFPNFQHEITGKKVTPRRQKQKQKAEMALNATITRPVRGNGGKKRLS